METVKESIDELFKTLRNSVEEMYSEEEPKEESKTEWIESFVELPEQDKLVLGYGYDYKYEEDDDEYDDEYFSYPIVVTFNNMDGWTNDDFEPMIIKYWSYISYPED